MRRCRYGCPQAPFQQAAIRSHTYYFARDAKEINIVSQNPLLLAYFGCHHCLEVIYSEQCIGYGLKYSSKNSDAGCISVQNVLYEGYSITPLREMILQLGFHLRLNVSLALMDIGAIT
jgi:hypothetical protein